MSWLADSHFLHHEACPKCGSSDANAVYSDGHTYCFSCRHRTPATKVSMVVQPKKTSNLDLKPMPLANRTYLRRYLNDDEIDEFFLYDANSDRHIFAYHLGEDDYYLEGRSANPARIPKYHSEGNKPDVYLIGPWKETGIVVLVEDIVSAIKVSRVYGAMPLFGCYISPTQIAKLNTLPEIKKIIIWLDEDKWGSSMYASRNVNYIRPTIAMFTENDPKTYSEYDIRTLIENNLATTGKYVLKDQP